MNDTPRHFVRKHGNTVGVPLLVMLLAVMVLGLMTGKQNEVAQTIEKNELTLADFAAYQTNAFRKVIEELETQNSERRNLEANGTAIVYADKQTHIITHWLGASEQIFGWHKSEVVGRKTIEDLMQADVRQAHAERYREAMTRNESLFHLITCTNAVTRYGRPLRLLLILSAPKGVGDAMGLIRELGPEQSVSIE